MFFPDQTLFDEISDPLIDIREQRLFPDRHVMPHVFDTEIIWALRAVMDQAIVDELYRISRSGPTLHILDNLIPE